MTTGGTGAFAQWHLERNYDAQFSGLADDLQNICDILCMSQNDGSNTYETRFLLNPYSNYMIRWSSTIKKARRHLPRSSEVPTARRLTFLSGLWYLIVQAIGKNWFSLITCSWSPQLHLFAANVRKGNEQPEESSTICISVLRERSI